jgi:putative membrane protein
MFHAKMGLFVAVLLLEAWPMVTLIRWRIAKARGAAIDTTPMGTFVWINHLETAAILLMPLAAVAMARGVGM